MIRVAPELRTLNIPGFIRRIFYLGMTLLGMCCLTASGQKIESCHIDDAELRAINYKVGFRERTVEGLPFAVVFLSIKPENVNREFLILLARNLKQRFCKEPGLSVGIYDAVGPAVRFRPEFREHRDAFRGEYFLDRRTGEEFVRFSPVPDYNLHLADSIKIDLGSIPAP